MGIDLCIGTKDASDAGEKSKFFLFLFWLSLILEGHGYYLTGCMIFLLLKAASVSWIGGESNTTEQGESGA